MLLGHSKKPDRSQKNPWRQDLISRELVSHLVRRIE